MNVKHHSFMIALLLGTLSVLAADGPALDLQKYPQNTPKDTLSSIISALENRDFQYWIAQLIAPEDAKKLAEKYGSIEKAAAANADEKYMARVANQCETMKKMLEDNKTSEGEENGVKWVRYHYDKKILQLEKQADGRWCMNPRVSAEKPGDPQPK
jgi:hypothetical protein